MSAFHIAAKARQAMQEIPVATLLADKGIEGDRYFGKKPKLNVTLVQMEKSIGSGAVGALRHSRPRHS